jgi:hypothetical protein
MEEGFSPPQKFGEPLLLAGPVCVEMLYKACIYTL